MCSYVIISETVEKKKYLSADKIIRNARPTTASKCVIVIYFSLRKRREMH